MIQTAPISASVNCTQKELSLAEIFMSRRFRA